MKSPSAAAQDILYAPQSRAFSDAASAALIDEMLARLEAEAPSPLLNRLATGFPTALVCALLSVLAAGVLAAALAGGQVSGPGPQHARAISAAPAAQPAVIGRPLATNPVAERSELQPDPAQPSQGLLSSLLSARHAQMARAENMALMGSPPGLPGQ